MTTSAGTRIRPPLFEVSSTRHRRAISTWAFEVNQGHIPCTGIITLTANATSTTVADARAGVATFVGFMPTTANAAAEQGNGTLYVATRSEQIFVITHANNAQADRTFVYCLLG